MRILFDLRKTQNYGIVVDANKNLRIYCPDLIELYGEIGSTKWWDNYDSGRITKKIVAGKVISIQPEENDDLGDAVTIQTSEGKIAFDYWGYWTSPEVKIGSIIEIVRIKSTTRTNTGPMTYIIDVEIKVITN